MKTVPESGASLTEPGAGDQRGGEPLAAVSEPTDPRGVKQKGRLTRNRDGRYWLFKPVVGSDVPNLGDFAVGGCEASQV